MSGCEIWQSLVRISDWEDLHFPHYHLQGTKSEEAVKGGKKYFLTEH